MPSITSIPYSSVSTTAANEADTASTHLYATMHNPRDEVLPENVPVYSAAASKDAVEELDEDVYVYDY